MKFSDTSYFQVPEDSECVLNAVQMSKLIDEPATTVRSWADKHERYLYIKKINDRFVYTQASVEQFKFIKDLCRNKNFTHKQIEEHIKQHGFEFNKYDGGIVDPQNPLSFQALASALALENQKQLKQFMVDFVQYQDGRDEKLVKNINVELEQTVIEKNEEQSEYIINKNKEIVADLDQKIEQRDEERDIKLVEKLRDNTKDAKIKAQEKEIEELKNQLKNQPKSFLSILFGKKN